MIDILWVVVTILIFISGIYFSINLHLVQFDFKNMFKSLFVKTDNSKGITPISSLLMTLGARIGVGSIAGVAFSIYYGGVGSIFWLWLVGLISTPNTYAETALGMLYQERDNDMYLGGPSYYIHKGLGKKWLGGIYALLIIFSYVFGYVSIQANTITKSLQEVVSIEKWIIGFLICGITLLIIGGGLKKIVKVISKLVPIMTFIYLLFAFIVFFRNIDTIPNILINILNNAFSLRSFSGGMFGSIIIGIQRGIFSSEAGLGTCSISSSSSNSNDPASQSYLQMLGVYVTTFLICTATVIIILTSNYEVINVLDVNGIEIAQYAFYFHMGNIGNIVLFISILLFSFSTILTGYYDGEASLKYFFKKINKFWLWLLRIGSLLVIFLGCILSSTIVWEMVDLMTALLGLINIYALLKMRKDVKKVYFDYKNK